MSFVIKITVEKCNSVFIDTLCLCSNEKTKTRLFAKVNYADGQITFCYNDNKVYVIILDWTIPLQYLLPN